MDASKGVVFIGLDDKPDLNITGPITIAGFEDGTVMHPFAKKAREQAAAPLADPTVITRRQRRTKKETTDGNEPGSAEQGRKRSGRGRTRRQVDGPGSVV